jgi:hypothetical protein
MHSLAYLGLVIAVFTRYTLNPIFERDFVRSWTDLKGLWLRSEAVGKAELLHEASGRYLGLVHWSSESAWQEVVNSGDPALLRMQIKLESLCNRIQLLYTLPVLVD